MFLFTGDFLESEEGTLLLRDNVATLLKENPTYWNEVKAIDCEILGPYLKAHNIASLMECTFSFGFHAATSVSTTKLIKLIFNALPACAYHDQPSRALKDTK